MLEKLYTVEEVAELASVTGRTIRNYLKSGRLVGRKIGGQWRFPESEVQRLLSGADSQPVKPAEQSAPVQENMKIEQREKAAEPPKMQAQEQPASDIYEENDDFSLPVFNDETDITGQDSLKLAYPENQKAPLSYDFSYETGNGANKAVEIPQNENYSPANTTENTVYRQQSSYKIPEKLTFLPESNPPAPPQVRNPNPAGQIQQDYKDLAHLPPKNYPEQVDGSPQINAFPYKQNIPQPQQPAYNEPPVEYRNENNAPAYNGGNINRPQVQPIPDFGRQEQARQAEAGEQVFTQNFAENQNTPSANIPPVDDSAAKETSRQNTIGQHEEIKAAGEGIASVKTEKENSFVDMLSDVGIKSARFSAEVHTNKPGGNVCCVIDLNEGIEKSKIKLEALFKLIDNSTDANSGNEVYLEYDERITIARYTIFGNLKFLNKCTEIISG